MNGAFDGRNIGGRVGGEVRVGFEVGLEVGPLRPLGPRVGFRVGEGVAVMIKYKNF